MELNVAWRSAVQCIIGTVSALQGPASPYQLSPYGGADQCATCYTLLICVADSYCWLQFAIPCYVVLLICTIHNDCEARGTRLQWEKYESQNFNGCSILSQAIGQEKLKTVFVFEIGHLEGPHVAFTGHNSKFK